MILAQSDKQSERGFPAVANIVNELKESEIDGE